MKTISAGLDDHLNSRELTIATCWKLNRTDGIIMGFTDLDNNILFDIGDGDGDVLYNASTGYTRTNITTTADLAVDNLEVDGVLDSSQITGNDIRAGRYDAAKIKMFIVNYENLSHGSLKLRSGELGDISQNNIEFKAELRGLMQKLTMEQLEVFAPGCRADFGNNPLCKVKATPDEWQSLTSYIARVLGDAGIGDVVKSSQEADADRNFVCITSGISAGGEPSWNLTLGGTTSDGSTVWETRRAFTITVTVDVVDSNRKFSIISLTDAPDALFSGGLATCTSGSNINLSKEIKSFGLSPTEIVVFEAFPFDIQAGDTFNLRASCLKTVPACISFDNIDNMRAEPYVPGMKKLIKIPDARN